MIEKLDNSKCVISLSGGMDSAVLLAHMLNKGLTVEAIGFTYGSKHNAKEIEAAQKLTQHYGIKYQLVELDFIGRLFKSDLLESGGPVPEGHYEDESMSKTVVPARNIIFLSILSGYAWSVGASNIAIGVHSGDHAIYPDCRPEFIARMAKAIYAGSDDQVKLVAPFLNIDKAEICKIGLQHKVPFELTWTCYKGGDQPCGKCGSCTERLEAFHKNSAIDPLIYA